MRLALCAHDIGPAKNLGMIAAEALFRKHRVSLVGNDDLSGREVLTPDADILVTGLSSFKNDVELALGAKAREMGKKWFVHADSFRTGYRQNARGKVSGATLIVADPSEIDEAKGFGYDDAVYLGRPPVWQSFASTVPAEIKRRSPDSKIILITGDKDGKLTNAICANVVSALTQILPDAELILSRHPNEALDGNGIAERREILRSVKMIDTSAPSTELVPHADCVVTLAGATDSVSAGYMRKPVICVEDAEWRETLNRLTGSPRWQPVILGAALSSEISDVREALAQALNPQAAAELRKRQEAAFPIPTGNERPTENAILRYLEEQMAA